jgi:hypothetical protein
VLYERHAPPRTALCTCPSIRSPRPAPGEPAPPALREALYEVAANLPGVKLVGHYKDALGRIGTAVEQSERGLATDRRRMPHAVASLTRSAAVTFRMSIWPPTRWPRCVSARMGWPVLSVTQGRRSTGRHRAARA